MPSSRPVFRARRRAVAAGMLLVACAALAPAAVAPPVRADESGLADRWMDATAARIGLHKVLIVGIAKDPRARRRFEDRLVTVLRTHNTEGVTSYSIVPDLQAPGDPEANMKTLFALRVDGVITVRLKPVDAKSEEAWAAGWRAAQQEPQRARAYVETSLREINPEADDFAAEVTLWAMGSVEPGRRIWAGRFPRQSINYLRKHVNEMVQLVVDEMQYKDLF
ncbi:MAG TPA: hypothetical protein VFB49_03200 [Patescibacteria group bacterium]|nr:hypothetical protein [Patescibacteria group bacterium]